MIGQLHNVLFTKFTSRILLILVVRLRLILLLLLLLLLLLRLLGGSEDILNGYGCGKTLGGLQRLTSARRRWLWLIRRFSSSSSTKILQENGRLFDGHWVKGTAVDVVLQRTVDGLEELLQGCPGELLGRGRRRQRVLGVKGVPVASVGLDHVEGPEETGHLADGTPWGLHGHEVVDYERRKDRLLRVAKGDDRVDGHRSRKLLEERPLNNSGHPLLKQ
jgi:hypothetical protein